MRRQTILNDEQLALDLPDQCFHEFNELRPAKGAVAQLKVKVPKGDAGNDRQLFPVEAVLQHRRLAFGCPGLDAGGTFAQSGFVDKDDGACLSAGLFFSAGQRLAFHCALAASSRWMALPVGRWLEKPSARKMCQTLGRLNSTPNSRFISAATRASVHNSVANPFSSAPASSSLDNRFRSFALSAAGRPNCLRRHACGYSANILDHVLAVCRVTSHRRATSACGTPRASRGMPLRRRNSMLLKSRLYRFVAIASPQSAVTSNNVYDNELVVTHL